MIQFSRAAATDLAEYGIRVNCIAPGHIGTGITNYDLGAVIRLSQPLQRQGTPADVAYAAKHRLHCLALLALPHAAAQLPMRLTAA